MSPTLCAAATSDSLTATLPWDPITREPVVSDSDSASSSEDPRESQFNNQNTSGAPLKSACRNDSSNNNTQCGRTDDLHLATRLVELAGVPVGPERSLTDALQDRFNASPTDVRGAARLLMKCLRLLRQCGYCAEDIVVIVAHATSYVDKLSTAMSKEGLPPMELDELANVLCVLMYVAHSYTQDQNCPLAVWHKHLFSRYCSLDTLNEATVSLFERLHYILRVKPSELDTRIDFLKSAESSDKHVAAVRTKIGEVCAGRSNLQEEENTE